MTGDKHHRLGGPLADRHHRGIAVVATAADQDLAQKWQSALSEQGIMSVLRGHREDTEAENGPYTGVDVLVAATALQDARDVLGPELATDEETGRPFPWLWLALGPAVFFAVALVLSLVLLTQ